MYLPQTIKNAYSSKVLQNFSLIKKQNKNRLNARDLIKIDLIIKKHKNKVNDMIVYGIFNFPSINWNRVFPCLSIEMKNSNSIEQNNLKQKIVFLRQVPD